MNYTKLLKADIANGPGFRLTLWVTGCMRKCPGCFNEEAQDPDFGKKFDDVWSYPYRLDVTCAVKEGSNKLKVSVTDTWFNRLVYDAGQPEEKRRTWTIAGPSANAALRDSGLIGPVRILRGRAPGLLRTSR